MAKEAYYFSHDSNARNDVKVVKLRRQLGLEGYAIYFILIEILREQEDHKLSLQSIPDLAYEIHTSEEKMKAVVCGFELFQIDENFFFSQRLIRSMDEYKAKINKYIEAGRKGGQASVKRRSSNAQARKERKGKEIKGNILKEIRYPFGEKFLEKWRMWKDFKKSQFDFVYKTEISEQAALDDLIKISGNNEDAAAEIIMQSVSKGWKGFFKIKNDSNGANRQNYAVNGTKLGTSEARTDKLKSWGLGGE
jgi:hypothetical protein